MTNDQNADNLLCVGVISGVHGIKGDVKIKAFTQRSEDISSYGTLLDKNGKVLFALKKYRITPKAIIVSLEGVTDRNKAETLRGTKLYVPRETLPETQEDEFYYSDLTGLQVKYEDGSLYGIIESMQNFGAGDLVEISPLAPNINDQVKPENKTAEQKPQIEPSKKLETVFFNFTEQIFPTIDLTAGYVIINPPEIIEDEPV